MVSLNEIQVTTRKAGQGCGLAYGLAEDLNPLIVGSTLGDRLLLGSGGADYSARGDGAGFASRLSFGPVAPGPPKLGRGGLLDGPWAYLPDGSDARTSRAWGCAQGCRGRYRGGFHRSAAPVLGILCGMGQGRGSGSRRRVRALAAIAAVCCEDTCTRIRIFPLAWRRRWLHRPGLELSLVILKNWLMLE